MSDEIRKDYATGRLRRISQMRRLPKEDQKMGWRVPSWHFFGKDIKRPKIQDRGP